MKYAVFFCSLLLFACNQSIKYPKGGFAYPKHVAAKDTNFYYYQLRDSFSRRDSFLEATRYITYQLFGEFNLSLKPARKDVFRLTYGAALGRFFYLIILTEDNIIVKKGDYSLIAKWDTSRLSEKEKMHIDFFRRYFPVEERLAQLNKSSKRFFYLDSLVKANPQLLDVNYYKSLDDKETVYNKETFKYTTTKIPITKAQFDTLVNGINASGFWQLPYDISKPDCMDGAGWSMEANTANQYKVVKDGNCADTTGFSKAYQKIIDFAGLSNEIYVYSDPSKIDTSKPSIIVQDVELEEVPRARKHRRARH